MASDAKIRPYDCGITDDRISNMPRSVLDLILDGLPLHDAARTSILSKTWRGVWEMHPNLVFDVAFYSQLFSKKDEQFRPSKVSRTISNILFASRGPILKFHLIIPHFMPLQLDMDLWIKKISNLGVKDLILLNKSPLAYKIPSYLFSCSELTHLSLSNCVFNPPHRFGGFGNMINVQLVREKITADMSFGSRLNGFNLENCTGIEHLGCQFGCDSKNLTRLLIVNCGEFDWQWLECIQNLQTFGLILSGVPNPREKVINFEKLIGNMPRIKSLFLDPFSLMFLEPGEAIMKRLMMKNLDCMSLLHFGFYNLVQIRNALCLMRSSPTPKCLHTYVKSEDVMNLAASSELQFIRFLQSPTLINMIFHQLRTLKINGMVGSRVELQFIRFLLASSPSLGWIKLLNTRIDDLKEEVRISKELMSFPRAQKLPT